jgi:hypothetical protein
MLKYDTGANQQRSQSMQQESGSVTEPQRDPRTPPMQQVAKVTINESPKPLPFIRGMEWRPLVNWSTVQSKVVAMPFDVLVLIDACEAAGALHHTDTSNACARNEIIAACPPNIGASTPPRVNTYRDKNPITYTRTLARMLTDNAQSNREVTVAKIHVDVANDMLDRMYNEGNVALLQRIPQYFVVSEISGQPGISLRVLPPTVDRSGADGHNPRNPHDAYADEFLDNDNPVEEEHSDPGEGPSQAHLAGVSGRDANINQASSLDGEHQHDGEPDARVSPALTSQTHAPMQVEPVVEEDRNFETGIGESRPHREEPLRRANQSNDSREAAQTQSDEDLERMVEAHNREIRHHFNEKDRLEALIGDRRARGTPRRAR